MSVEFTAPLLQKYVDYDETTYVILGRNDNKQALSSLLMTISREIFGEKWAAGSEYFKVDSSGASYQLIFMETEWTKLPVLTQIRLVARVEGFCESLDFSG